jgi:hypothetical protein
VLSRCRVTGALPVETRSNSVTSGAPRNLDASEGREGFPGQMFTFAGKTRPGPEGATARCRKSGSKFPPSRRPPQTCEITSNYAPWISGRSRYGICDVGRP